MKVWQTIPGDKPLARQIAAKLKLPQAAAEVLLGLGYSDCAEIERFLNPRLSDLSDPFLLPDLEPAVQRIWQAILNNEPIVVYGDYDVDGIVGTALLLQVLQRLGASAVTSCLPDRQEEGYGLSKKALERCLAFSPRPRLLITVDCGTNAADQVRQAQQAGIDVVVTDHHESNAQRAPARAVVNPKFGRPEHLKDLAGVGVVFKLCHGLLKIGREQSPPLASAIDLREYLDLVAVGTVADIVPLRSENRILVRHGLNQMNRTGAPRWQELVEVAGIRGAIDTNHIGFGLGPRLNAAGRLAQAGLALELLITADRQRRKQIARELDSANRERQRLESAIAEEAIREIDAYFNEREHYGLVIGKSAWHAGVIGIVAARLVARYRRPAIVIAFNGERAGRGSGRSIEGFPLLKGLERCRQYLVAYGGHALAAGIEIESAQYEAFQAAFNAAARLELEGRDLRAIQRINAWVKLEELDDALDAALGMLRPFGQDNPKPVLAVRGVRLKDKPRRVGSNHLRFAVSDGVASRPAIAFGMADVAIPQGYLDVAFTFQKNSFLGKDTLELNVRAIRQTE